MLKILMYLWTIIDDLVDRVEISGDSGTGKQNLAVEAISALLLALGFRERHVNKWEEELRRVINAVVAIKNLLGEFDADRSGTVVVRASILGALK